MLPRRLILLLFTLWSAAGHSAERVPHWIWASPASDSVRVERRFQVEAAVPAAVLQVAADFCDLAIELNGRPLVQLEPYSPTTQIEITPHVVLGENRLTVTADRPCGPAAVALSVRLAGARGAVQHIVSDGDWQVVDDASARVDDLGPVAAELWGLGRRDATVHPFENYEQWRIAGSAEGDASGISAPPGFTVTRLRQAGPQEGSWISMAFDPQGRLTVSREDRGLLRFTLAEDRTVTKVETVNEDLQECRGLLYAYDSLYVNANNSKGLYRLRDFNADGQFDEVKLLREFPGRLGHGRNDLALGADGMIYSMHGDSVDLPTTDVIDRTSPLREARRGRTTSEGSLLRTDRDGQRWELVSAGLRNPYGIGVHPSGDLFTYDADAEFDMGAPWYRPTRVVQLRPGADFGWRGVTGQWPPYYPDHPDNAAPMLDIGRGSPTAVAFGTPSNFPPPYRQALFLLDWSYGRMLAVHLAPRGAGYRAAAETFLQGRPLNLTDLAFGPDGAMYVITGGRKTQSALYRIAYEGAAVEPAPTSQHEQDCLRHATAARVLREQLEATQVGQNWESLDKAWPHLDDPDPALRYAAQLAIEHRPVTLWRERAFSEQRVTAYLTLMTSLVRSGETISLDRVAALRPAELSYEQRRLLAHLYAILPESEPARVASQLQAMHALAPGEVGVTGGGQLTYQLTDLLARFSPATATPAIAPLLRSDRQEDRLQALLVLRSAKEGWTPALRRDYFTALNEMPRFVAGEGMPKFLAHLREQSRATLSDAERTALADVLDPAPEMMDEPPPLRPVVRKWTATDLASLLDPGVAGDAQRGEQVFRDAQCGRCHRVGARGPAVGPDLTFVGRRFSPRDMLESIILPSLVVAEHYRNVQVETTDGRTIVGRVLIEGDFRSETLRIAADPWRPAAVTEINKREVAEHHLSDVSPMPTGLLDGFHAAEIADLLVYLRRGPLSRASGP